MMLFNGKSWGGIRFLCLFWTTLATNAYAGIASQEEGQQLFFGKKPLLGKIVSQDFDLPIEASRCVNCHISDQQSQQSEFLKKTQTFGPALNYHQLNDVKSLRGGPVFSYTSTSFCELLRTGIDPTHIVSKRTMPRYVISNDECESLWMYLINIQKTD